MAAAQERNYRVHLCFIFPYTSCLNTTKVSVFGVLCRSGWRPVGLLLGQPQLTSRTSYV